MPPKKFKKSEKLFSRANRYLVGGVNSPVRSFSAVGGKPLFISKAKGSKIFDVDGNQYIDFMASWGPLILGHADREVLRAVKKASDSGTSYGAPCEDEIVLAKIVVDSVPSIEKVRMTNSGTEATMSAIRLARAYTGRDYIIKFEGCYHGHADHLLVKAGSGATTFGHPSSPGVPKSFTSKTLIAKYNNIDSVKKLYEKHGDKIAGVIIEPVAGNMGVVLPSKTFLRGLRTITRRYGSLLIFDEVITGFRLGLGGAQGHFGIKPDITCLGKTIGGGLPVGAYGGSKKIMSYVSPEGPMYQAGTLSGNPIAMAAGIANLNKIMKKDFFDNLNKRSGKLVTEINKLIDKHGINASVNSIGSLFTIFFNTENVNDYETAIKSDTKMFSKFFGLLLNSGVMFPPSQFETVFVSSSHTKEDIEKTVGVINRAFKNL
ncbi:MAG: glutamate-1-semialdehyde 2,1-aminomutase [Thermodesulfobacteriota bacterium]